MCASVHAWVRACVCMCVSLSAKVRRRCYVTCDRSWGSCEFLNVNARNQTQVLRKISMCYTCWTIFTNPVIFFFFWFIFIKVYVSICLCVYLIRVSWSWKRGIRFSEAEVRGVCKLSYKGTEILTQVLKVKQQVLALKHWAVSPASMSWLSYDVIR